MDTYETTRSKMNLKLKLKIKMKMKMKMKQDLKLRKYETSGRVCVCAYGDQVTLPDFSACLSKLSFPPSVPNSNLGTS